MAQKTAEKPGDKQNILIRIGKIITWLFAGLGLFIFVLAIFFLVTGYSSTPTLSADKVTKLNDAVDRLSKAQTFFELYNKTAPKTAELRQAYYRELADAAAKVDSRLRPLVENFTAHSEALGAYLSAGPQVQPPAAGAACGEQLNYLNKTLVWCAGGLGGMGIIAQDYTAIDNLLYYALRQDIGNAVQAANALNASVAGRK